MKAKIYNYLKFFGQGPRDQMQDACVHGSDAGNGNSWYIIADGLGGHPFGKEAAEITVNVLSNHLYEGLKLSTEPDFRYCIQMGLYKVQQEMESFVAKEQAAFNMATTFCCLLQTPDKLFFAWAGDSRLYQIRKTEIIFESIPHTWIFDRYRKGIFSKEEAELSQSNYLTASVNVFTEELRFDTAELNYKKGDKFIMVTDGVWDAFENEELVLHLTQKNADELYSFLNTHLKEYATDNYSGYIIF